MGNAQTYTYKPIGFDTSCYWLSEYYYYSDGQYCKGEKLSMVAKDTLIGTHRFSEIITYGTAFTSTNMPPFFCYGELNAVSISYLREDTAARKIYNSAGAVVLDYKLTTGDTMKIPGRFQVVPLIIDSISIQNINGIDRRLQWGQTQSFSGSSGLYHTIEGIGANYNFPEIMYGEWLIPTYKLRCYSKGAQTLFTDGSITNCPKKPRVPLSVANTPVLSQQTLAVVGQELKVLDAKQLPLQVQVYDLLGRQLRSYSIRHTGTITLDLAPGSYILHIQKEAQYFVQRIHVQ